MNVLVTGALGNVGSYTVDALLDEGHVVVAFDVESPRARRLASRLDARVHVAWGDITDPASIRAALESVDAVVHLAGIIPPKVDRAPELARRINVDGTRNLIEQMECSGTTRRLVFASSESVFGDAQDREPPLRVDTPVSPSDEYGRHKVACEEAIRRSRLHWSILRLAAVMPIRPPAEDLGIMFEFSPDARFEFLHPADAGTAFARAVACEQTIGKILNIAGGERCRTTYYEFCSDLMSAIGIGPVPTDAFVRTEVRRFFGDWLDTEESQRLLQYQKRGLSEQKEDMRKDFGAIVPLLRLLRPVATWYLTRRSPYLKENRRRGSS